MKNFTSARHGFKVKLSEAQPVCHVLALSRVLVPVQFLGSGFEQKEQLRVRSQPSP